MIMSTTKATRSLRLLSIDNGGINTNNGGVRGISPLAILRHILVKIMEQEGLPDIPRPCDVFDLAGGSGTGGIMVLMLFRLQMSIDAAVEAYRKLLEHVFKEKKWFFQEGTFKATRLEEAMLSIIQQSDDGDPRQVLLFNEQGPKCFVTASPPLDSQGMGNPTFLCSWTSQSLYLQYFTVVEAVRATTAVPTFFKAARIGPIPYSFLDIKLRCNNPTQYVMDMARELYGDRPISCLVSLGTGQTDLIRPPGRGYYAGPSDVYRRSLPKKLLRALQDVIRDCEQKSMDMSREISRHSSSILYSRWNDNYRNFSDSLFMLDRLLQVLKGTVANSVAVQISKDDHIPPTCSS